mgnify:CR=1 FL=1
MNLPILLIASLFWAAPPTPCPNLTVEEIRPPRWVDDHTEVEVVVRNEGAAVSPPTTARLHDLDLSVEEARSLELTAVQIDAIRENIARAKYTAENPMYADTAHVNRLDYDPDVKAFVDVPELAPDAATKLVFLIPDHWVYDSNCELGVVLDVDDEIEECDETDNTAVFVAWG